LLPYNINGRTGSVTQQEADQRAVRNAEGKIREDYSAGHAVYVYISDNSGKKRNTTAQTAARMDSAKDGPPGGWE